VRPLANLIMGQAHRGSRESEYPEKKITSLSSIFNHNKVQIIFVLFPDPLFPVPRSAVPCSLFPVPRSAVPYSLFPKTRKFAPHQIKIFVTFTFWLLPCAFFAVVLLSTGGDFV